MKRWVKTFVAVVVVLAAIPLLIFVYLEMREERDREAAMEKPVKQPSRVALSADRQVVVKLDKEAQARAALKIELLVATTLTSETAAYGRFEEDPSAGFTLRAPVSGTIRRREGRDWPTLGEEIREPGVVGLIDPRFAPADRVDMASRLSTAKADVDSRTASLSSAKLALERTRTLNAEEKSASDRALQDAEVRMKDEEARLRSAADTVRLLQASLTPGNGEVEALHLSIPLAGQVVEMLVRPGEVVESGQEILRVAKVDRLIARAVLPAGEKLEVSTTPARVLALGYEDRPLQGTSIGRARGALGETLLFRIDSAGLPLRSGMAFQAWIPAAGGPQSGVVIPRSALVRFGGKTWAYVQVAETEFSRRELGNVRPVANGWFMTQGFPAGQGVVTAGAQILLSEELKSQIQVGEEEMRKG